VASARVAFTAAGRDLDAPLELRFGRAPLFLIYDLDRETFEVIDNEPNLNAVQGAGIQAAEAVIRTGARAVVTGHCGPKAFRVLQAAGVTVHVSQARTISEALAELRSGSLEVARDADVEGHWS
jgi:predicted Fe-Mo cluster-binding NifX family protein